MPFGMLPEPQFTHHPIWLPVVESTWCRLLNLRPGGRHPEIEKQNCGAKKRGQACFHCSHVSAGLNCSKP